MINLSQLHIYPVKSMRGLALSHAQISASGAAFDRIFMLSEADGTFITARRYPQMVLFTPALLQDGLYLRAPDGSSATVRFADFTSQTSSAEVWGSHFSTHTAPTEINSWLSGFFTRQVQLRWLGIASTRRVKHHSATPLSFADGFPYLLSSESSLRDLQKRCPASVSMAQFRPNIVVTGSHAWDEDSWQTIRIGEVIFDVAKPCSRCILTTVSPEHGYQHPAREPLATLQRFRTVRGGKDIDFGLNLLARNSGIIRLGDEVEVLADKAPRLYGSGEKTDNFYTEAGSDKKLTIHFGEKHFQGNNQQTLLEQLELQGIKIPYSCRAGICGCCRVQLLKGDVRPLKSGVISSDGSLLSCSCIPAGDLRLGKC